MITPSFNLTATERVLPKLALDFTTASLDSRVTFTRTTGVSNPATYVGNNGYVTAATNNQPRFDYDPVTLVCKGLLIEESRANIVKYSNDYSQANWTKGQIALTTNATTSPDGTVNATKIAANSTIAEAYIRQTTTQSNSTTYTITAYAKKDTVNFLRLRNLAVSGSPNAWFNLNTGAVGTVGSGLTATITNAGNGWYRCSITGTTLSSIVNNLVDVAPANTNGSSAVVGNDAIFLFGVQLEAGAFATSYIPTTTTALTRNADVATMTGTNFSDWYTAGTGAFNCAVLPKSATGTKPVLQFDDATVLNTIAMQGNATAVELKITTLSVLQSTLSTGTITANTAYSSCGAWTTGSNALSKSGGVVTTGSPVSIPTVTQSRLGSDGTNYFNGWLQKINYWPQCLTNSEVQAFSK